MFLHIHDPVTFNMATPLPQSVAYDHASLGNYYGHYFGPSGEVNDTNARAQYTREFARFVGSLPGNPYEPADRETRAHQYPKAFEGQSVFLGKFFFGLSASGDKSFLLSEADGLPVVQTDQMRFEWKTLQMTRALMDQVPEEGPSRIVRTPEGTSDSATLLRWGIAGYMEHGFMNTPAGQQDFFLRLKMIELAIQDTYELTVLAAIMSCRVKVFDYEIKNHMRFTHRDRIRMIEERNAQFIAAQKYPNGMANAVFEGKNGLKIRGVDATTIWCPAKGEGFFKGNARGSAVYPQTLAPMGTTTPATDPYTSVETFHGVRIRILQEYKPDTQQGLPINPFQTTRTFGQMYRMFGRKIENVDLDTYLPSQRSIRFFNYERDQHEWVSIADALKHMIEFDGDETPGTDMVGEPGDWDLFATDERLENLRGQKKWARMLGEVNRKYLPFEVIKAIGEKALKTLSIESVKRGLRRFITDIGIGQLVSLNVIMPVGAAAGDDPEMRLSLNVTPASLNQVLPNQRVLALVTSENVDQSAQLVPEKASSSSSGVKTSPAKMHDETKALLLSVDKGAIDSYTSVVKTLKDINGGTLLPAFLATSHGLVHAPATRSMGISKIVDLAKLPSEKIADAANIFVQEHGSSGSHAPSASAPVSTSLPLIPATKTLKIMSGSEINDTISAGNSVTFLNSNLEPSNFNQSIVIQENSPQANLYSQIIGSGVEFESSVDQSANLKNLSRLGPFQDGVRRPINTWDDFQQFFRAVLDEQLVLGEQIFTEFEHNVSRASAIPHQKLRQVVLMLLYCQITRPFLKFLNENKLIFPFGFLVFRPWMQAITSSAIIAGMGRQLGFFAVGKSDVMFADDANIKAHRFHYTSYFHPIIYRPQAIWFMDDIWMTDFYSGHNMTWFDKEAMDDVKANRFRPPSVLDGGDYSQFPSIFCCLTAYDDPELRNTVDLRGKFRRENPDNRMHYIATKKYFDKWNFEGPGDVDDVHPNDPDTTPANYVCSQALQFVYNHVTNSHSSILPVTDCMGPNIYDGCMQELRNKTGANGGILRECMYERLLSEY